MRDYIELFQNKLWYQSCIALLAFISGGMFLYEIFGKEVAPETKTLLDRLDLAIAYIFLTDFSLGVVLAPKKLRHIKTNWLDLLGSIPFSDGLFRTMRILRFTRLVRLLRAGNSGLNVKSSVVTLKKRKEKNSKDPTI